MDMIRRQPDAPYGAIDFLIERAIERCHTSKADVLSLGLIALADHHQEMIPIERELTQCLSPPYPSAEGASDADALQAEIPADVGEPLSGPQ